MPYPGLLGGELLPKVARPRLFIAPNTDTSHLTPNFSPLRPATSLHLPDPGHTGANRRHSDTRKHYKRATAESTTTTVAAATASSQSRLLGPGSLILPSLINSTLPRPLPLPSLPHHHRRPRRGPPRRCRLRRLPRPTHRLSLRSSQRTPKKTRPQWPPSRESCSSSLWGTTS